jgi:hypothetical protein
MTFLACALLLSVQKTPDRELQGTAAKCGSEIPWTRSLEEAREQSRSSGKPIAWWVSSVEGSPMDRKQVIENYMLSGPFMMAGVVDLLSTRFVPLRLAGSAAHRVPFGIAPFEFIEPGLVFLSADLKVLHKVDRITTFSEEWFVHLLRGVLRKAGREIGEKKVELSAARRAITEGRPDPALFETASGDEARWFHGVALHLTGRDDLGRVEWRKIQSGRWAWKAAAELARDGPFVRGFEIYEALPPEALQGLPATTTLPRAKPEVARAVRFLLQTQRADGGWDDSNYNYGGDDSLPNVHLAVTALAALALREWADDQAQAALARAGAYLRDESPVAAKDRNEIAWATAYRLIYFARTNDRKMMALLVRKLSDLQKQSGTWAHEYDNPFVTATALHAIEEAKQAGADVPAALLRRGADALRSTRDAKGVFSYYFPGKGGAVEGAAGRMAFCEHVLTFSGQATAASVTGSLVESFKHHDLLEKVRKYDDHADRFHNGGFFFWYDQYGRAVAARAAQAGTALDRQRQVVVDTAEIDGCWVDSHELGRVYGTAMALLTLKLCEK